MGVIVGHDGGRPSRREHPETARRRQAGHDGDRGVAPDRIRDHAGEDSPDDKPGVSPEPVDTDGLSAVERRHDIRDRGDEGRIHECGAHPKQHSREQRPHERDPLTNLTSFPHESPRTFERVA